MAHESIGHIIERQLRDKGITEYHIEPVFVNGGGVATEVIIKANNEFWFLVSNPAFVPATFQMVSDTEPMINAADYANLNYSEGIRAHSGRIRITQAVAPIKAEFLRVQISATKRKRTIEAITHQQLITGNLVLEQIAPMPIITTN